MAVPLEVTSIPDAQYNGSDTNTWTAQFKSTDGTTTFGTLTNGSSQSYSQTSAAALIKAVVLIIDSGGDPMSVAAGETITITTDGGDVDIYLPALSAADMNTYYVDSNGLLYSDASLTTPVIDTGSEEETLSTGEEDTEPFGTLDESLGTTEDEWGFPDGTTDDVITIGEDAEPHSVFVLVDTIGIEDIADLDIKERVVEVISVGDGTFVVRPVYLTEALNIISSGDIVRPVIVNNAVQLGDSLFISVGAFKHIVEALSVSDELSVQAFVFVLTDALGVGEQWQNKRGTQSADDSTQYTAEEKVTIVTTPFDFRQRGHKFIDFIEVGGSDFDDVELMLAFRYTQDEDWRNTNWMRLNREGVCYVGVAGNEFKLAIRRTKGRFVPTYVTVYWKLLDKRYVRSGYESQTFNA